MKKKFLRRAVFGIAVLLTAALFTITACGGGAGGGGITTIFKFEDKAPPASLNRSVGRSARGISRAMMEGTRTDEASFTQVTDYYTGLSGKQPSITPTEFSLALGNIDTVTNGQVAAFFETGDPSAWIKVNFAENVTVVPTYPAEAGSTTTTVNISFMGGGGIDIYGQAANAKAKVTFPINSSIHAEIKAAADAWPGEAVQHYNQYGIYSISDASITVTPQSLLPLDNFNLNFRYTGTEYKWEEFMVTPPAPLPPGIDHLLVIPMNTIVLPDDISSVTFGASMELDGIIEHYKDSSDPKSMGGNRFVLANKFWERLAIGATF